MLSSIKLTDFLSWFDYSVLFSSLGLTYFLASYGKRTLKSDDSPAGYILMGRRLSLPLFVGTLVATWYGGIFGVTEIAFKQGVFNFFTQGVFWYITYILFAFFLVQRIRHEPVHTLPELVARKFGFRAGYLASVFNFFNVLPVAYVLSLGIFIRALSGWDLAPSIFLGIVFVGFYTGIGGFASVVYTDFLQFFLMYIGVALVLGFSITNFGGYNFLSDRLPAHYFSPQGGESLLSMFVWGLIALGTLVDPNFYQRCLAAVDTKTAKRGILISTVMWVGFDICTTFGGMYAAALIPEAKPSEAYLTFAIQILPDGLRGFFVAGILATILSTIDSFAFIAANTISYDLLGKTRYRSNLWLWLVLILAGIVALQFDGSFKKIWKLFGSYSAGCLLLPLMIKMFVPRLIEELDFIVSSLAAAIVITVWRLSERQGFLGEVDAIYPGLLCSGLVLFFCALGRRVKIFH